MGAQSSCYGIGSSRRDMACHRHDDWRARADIKIGDGSIGLQGGKRAMVQIAQQDSSNGLAPSPI
jgi:hypothetical protein